MKEKQFRFENGGMLTLCIDDGQLSVHLQARHIGEESRFTSAGVMMDVVKSCELLAWLKENLQDKEVSTI